MLKPTELRAAITLANPELQVNPERLVIFLDAGRIVAHGASSLSYEYQYTLNVIVQDYAYHADRIILPMLAYLRTHQSELFENDDKANQLIRFEAELLSHDLLDLSLQVDLTERVIVKQTDGGTFTAKHVGEPDHPDFPSEAVFVEMVDKDSGEVMSSYSIPAWAPTTYRYE